MGVVLGGVNQRSVSDMFEICCTQKINKLFLRGNAFLCIFRLLTFSEATNVFFLVSIILILLCN